MNINKVDKPLTRWTMKKGEKAQITKIRKESADMNIYSMEILRIISEHYGQRNAKTLYNLDKMNKFLEIQVLPR